MTRHGRDCPARCSQCAGVPVRRVDVVGPVVTVDGVEARAAQADPWPDATRKRQRGGRATKGPRP